MRLTRHLFLEVPLLMLGQVLEQCAILMQGEQGEFIRASEFYGLSVQLPANIKTLEAVLEENKELKRQIELLEGQITSLEESFL